LRLSLGVYKHGEEKILVPLQLVTLLQLFFSRNSQEQYGTPMPHIGQTTVEVDLLNYGVIEGDESCKHFSELKVLHPWMIKDGMNLTKEQRLEKIESQKLEKYEAKGDKRHDLKDDQSVQEEYINAYYEALRKSWKRKKQKAECSMKARFLSLMLKGNAKLTINTSRMMMKKALNKYSSFLIWTVGTQGLLCNPLSTVALTLALWRFFSKQDDLNPYVVPMAMGI